MKDIKDQDLGWQNGMAKSITFIVTKDCQLACKYCYLVGKNTKEQMTWELSLLLREPHFACHLSDDAEVYSGGILLVVDGEQGYAPLVIVNYGQGSDNAGAATLATPFGSDGHTNLADAGAEFYALKGIPLEALKEVGIVICNAAMALGEPLDGSVEIAMSINFVAHRLRLQRVGNSRNGQSQGILSRLSAPGKPLRSRCGGAWRPFLLRASRASGCSCPDANAPLPARRCQPKRRTWSCSHGNRLSKLLSYSQDINCWCKGNESFLIHQ